LYYLTQKLGLPVPPSELLADINDSREFVFSELGQAQLEKMEEVAGVPEMHDRLIAAECLVHDAPIISRDQALRSSGAVEVIW
jgi:PIN domain nuclease of toxin-antitoxin system